ncbi:MAG: hypothetical protein H7138_18510 [Myxococcales bacterium]|nr:hypothetical protein [Myxococcales bacterium]
MDAASRATYFDSTLKMLPGVTIPLRAMAVANGERQILISPIGTPEEEAKVDGTPLTVVAPSLLHHLHLERAIERYRPVALWGPPGLAEKHPDLGPMHVLGEDPWPHADQLEFVIVEGAPRRNEVVFFHKASRSIYTADLFFNIRKPEGFLTPIAFRLMGIHKRFAAMKMWRHWVTDRAAFARSIDQILAWDFDRIVVAHGDVATQNARGQFVGALRELELIA